MKEIIFNEDNLTNNDIDEVVTRVKALIINSKEEIMLGYSNKTYQFPGGHLEEGEDLSQGLIREIKEETGIKIKNNNLHPFQKITYLSKNYRNTGLNRKNNIYYFIVNTDETVNKSNMNLDEGEIKGNYTVKTIPLINLEKTLINNIPDNPINEIIVKEMLEVFKEYKRISKIKLKPLKQCINKSLYKMYQDIPQNELGSNNTLYGLDYEEFKLKCKELIEEENIIKDNLDTTTNRYILYDGDIPIGEIGIRTTLNDFWINHGSQIYYKIRLSKRKKGYGNIILSLAIKEAKNLGFKKVRINCDDSNVASKKIILNNGGKIDIRNYKTKDGSSSSYIIEV